MEVTRVTTSCGCFEHYLSWYFNTLRTVPGTWENCLPSSRSSLKLQGCLGEGRGESHACLALATTSPQVRQDDLVSLMNRLSIGCLLCGPPTKQKPGAFTLASFKCHSSWASFPSWPKPFTFRWGAATQGTHNCTDTWASPLLSRSLPMMTFHMTFPQGAVLGWGPQPICSSSFLSYEWPLPMSFCVSTSVYLWACVSICVLDGCLLCPIRPCSKTSPGFFISFLHLGKVFPQR